MFQGQIFWKDNFTDGEAQGGIFTRAVELKQFLELVEENLHGNGGEVVGLRFDENNLEVIIKK